MQMRKLRVWGLRGGEFVVSRLLHLSSWDSFDSPPSLSVKTPPVIPLVFTFGLRKRRAFALLDTDGGILILVFSHSPDCSKVHALCN